jgi:hypothetical protein
MEKSDALWSYTQSEKIKAGMIWLNQCVENCGHYPEPQKIGAERLLRLLIGMIALEIQLIRKMTQNTAWTAAEKHLNQAIVMINSGVAQEVPFHVAKALSQVTSIGSQALDRLKKDGLAT